MRMFTSASENARCFHATVTDPLKISVEKGVAVIGLCNQLSFFFNFLFFGSPLCSQFFCTFYVLFYVPEIKIVQTFGAKRLRKESEERADKVFPDSLFVSKFAAVDLHPLIADFFDLWSDFDWLTLSCGKWNYNYI